MNLTTILLDNGVIKTKVVVYADEETKTNYKHFWEMKSGRKSPKQYTHTKSLSLISTDISSLTKIICHRNFGNEFAFTHCKYYLYYLARSPLSQISDNETSPQN